MTTSHQELQCLSTLTRFYRCLDGFRYQDMMALMAPGAVWHRQGEVLTSPDAMIAALSKRSATRSIVHLLTNLFVESGDGTQATVRGYQTAYAFDDGTQRTGPAPLEGASSIASIEATLTNVDGQWLIRQLGSTKLFAR
ncbi:hypothetical protein BH09PSE5_BH09PSE5_00590 [soil metagenome]